MPKNFTDSPKSCGCSVSRRDTFIAATSKRKDIRAGLLVASLLGMLTYARPTRAEQLGDVTALTQDMNTHTISAGADQVRVIFYKPEIVRIWLGPGGEFTNPAADDIVVSYDFPAPATSVSDAGDYYELSSDSVVVRAYKTPLRFEMHSKDGAKLIWREAEPLSWDSTSATQKLVRGAAEHFYGGGMQNGYFSHRDTRISIAIDNEWNDGGHPNPAPFYMSTAGYGVYRNTWDTGAYDFRENTLALVHDEARFDAFYFYGPSLKRILSGYTEITGRPYLAPLYGFELGNADCYNTSNPDYTGTRNKPGKSNTPDVIEYAKAFREADMPAGWYLPNDGYGCGYQELESVVSALDQQGFYTGLWTQSGLANIATEVGTYGTRMVKTDVAWVGNGYKFALDGVKQAFAGIEDNSDARAYIWTVDGWSGTQRYAVVWTGDQSGDWENIRFHIPTLIGAGLSAQNYASGDIDGIFGGSPETYVRDLQWKAFIQTLMTMSGWATPEDKQPYQFDEPYKSINRKYLKLRERLLPYFYSYAAEAYETGVPAVRAMVLEFPEDEKTWDKSTAYQFMSGEWLLVAPIYEDSAKRSGIYLPAGTWIDYWDGTRHVGPTTLDDYDAPLDKLPLFVRAGAILPLWPEMLHFREKPHDPLTFDVYPDVASSFTLYEDDGVTRAYRDGAFAKQIVGCNVATLPNLSVHVGASSGSYTGKPSQRSYRFEVHLTEAPPQVRWNDSALTARASLADLEAAAEGWFFSATDRNGVVYVKTAPLALDQAAELVFGNGAGSGGAGGGGGAAGSAGGSDAGGAAGSSGMGGNSVGGSSTGGAGGTAVGGAAGTSGEGGQSTAGQAGTGGALGTDETSETSGCSCSFPSGSSRGAWFVLASALGAAGLRRRAARDHRRRSAR